MFATPSLTTLPPAIAIHLVLALGALVLGPIALRARKGTPLHRASGYAWATLMIGAALSSIFIRDFRLPNLGGYTPIHILTVATLVGVGFGIWHVVNRRIAAHKQTMWRVYLFGCVGAGLFALSPTRYLGHMLWHSTLGLV